jgi:hypothetical protein
VLCNTVRFKFIDVSANNFAFSSAQKENLERETPVDGGSMVLRNVTEIIRTTLHRVSGYSIYHIRRCKDLGSDATLVSQHFTHGQFHGRVCMSYCGGRS